MDGFWGTKVGMTQLFVDNRVIPVTAIEVSNWYVTQVKTVEADGYSAIQLGCLKPRYAGQPFDQNWLKKLNKYFRMVREVHYGSEPTLGIGDQVDLRSLIAEQDVVTIYGTTKGAGFQGVVKRWRFAGGPASHGATFGRFPGSLSNLRECGRVFPGKAMPGQMGNKRRAVRNLPVIKLVDDAPLLLVKGSIPGKPGSYVFVRKV